MGLGLFGWFEKPFFIVSVEVRYRIVLEKVLNHPFLALYIR